MSQIYPAATVLLLRDSSAGLQVFMVLRHHEIDSFSGALVFPGGKLDAGDHKADLRPFCRNTEAYDDCALAFRVAAVREAFEECGVLLARRQGQPDLLLHAELTLWEHYRQDLLANQINMLDVCLREKLELAVDLLVPFAHWITPKIRPKVFDTHFFLAPAPPNQLAAHDGSESLDSMWITPQDAIQRAEAGQLNVIFPTRMNLQRLSQVRTVRDALALAAREPVVSIQPTVETQADGQIMTIPPDTPYRAQRVFIPKDGRRFQVLE